MEAIVYSSGIAMSVSLFDKKCNSCASAVNSMADKDSVELIKFDETNYSMRKFGIMFAFGAKELISLDGTEKEPDMRNRLTGHNGKKISSQAAVLSLNSIEKALHPRLINCRTPNEMWL